MTTNLPALQSDIRRFPMLTAEDELNYAKAWQKEGDKEAAHKLVTSHLRLVVKLAMGYRGYGLQVSELISEGNIGLMQAVRKFDPYKGFRLSTYAIWWIKAAMQEYVLKSWSLVKIGTTAAQKKLFFNLRKIKNRINAIDSGDMAPDEVATIASELNVSDREVVDMNRRMMGHDQSLNTPMRSDGEEGNEWIDQLEDEARGDQESNYAARQELTQRSNLLGQSLSVLNEREIDIFKLRRLQEPQATLADLSKKYEISSERVRQIENRAFEKVQKFITDKAADLKYLEDQRA